jgi:3-deoxy-7-phosphoheptulonate synthase
MLVVMSHHATAEDVERVCATIRSMGYTPAPMPGAQRTAVGLVGNDGAVDDSLIVESFMSPTRTSRFRANGDRTTRSSPSRPA